ncbi:hypothetical protein [uncultured Sphingomonas sp.]|uniref:hypothetical protein n=1 Tax=uncultured Sphingomonas sp. TaxID=158754 RepID=UPI0025CF3571|nr:hypothetical protein [uncultured Sphingomonas sp.]
MRALLPMLLVTAVATPAAAQWRQGQQPMAGGPGAMRPGQPMTMDAPPPAADPDRATVDRFAAAYGRAGRPRVALLWNRELTAEVETGREEVSTLTVDGRSSTNGEVRETLRRRGSLTTANADADHHVEAELRSTTRALDSGARTAAADEGADFDMERGLAEALSGAGVRLIDRTAILRTGALGADTTNMQAIETRALLGKAEWTLEVVAMNDGRWRIVARDLASGQVVARAVSAGRPAPRPMPWVAGEHGFVRATAPDAGPYAVGRQIALDAMKALARR